MTETLYAQANPTGVTGYATTSENGSYGILFTVSEDCTLEAIWFYSPDVGTPTLPSATSLYSTTDGATGTLITHNTSPSWSGAPGSGWVRDNSFPATALSAADTYVGQYYGNGIEQGYLYTGSFPPPWFPQTSSPDGLITAAETYFTDESNAPYLNGSDDFPTQGINVGINWLIDVEVSTGSSDSVSGAVNLKKMKVSASGASTFTLFNGDAHGLTGSGDEGAYTLGIQFSVSEDTELLGMEWYSAATSEALPATIALYEVSGHTLVHSETPTWSGAAGSGFVSAEFSSPPTLSADTDYVGVVWYGGGNSWYSEIFGYWTSGAGASGITNGILSAPSNADSAAGQALYQSGSLAYPTTTTSGYDFGVDVKVMAVALTSSASGTIKLKKCKLYGTNVPTPSGYSWFNSDNGGNGFWDSEMDLANWNIYGDMQTAITFKVTDDDLEVGGYYYWYDTAEDALIPGGFALWSTLTEGAGIVVDGSVINEIETPTETGWQYVPLDTPVTLTADTPYKVEFAASGGFFWSNAYIPFETSGIGITNGPLVVYSDAGGDNPIPSGDAQSSFATATNVAGTTYPDSGYDSAAAAIDILVQSSTPPGQCSVAIVLKKFVLSGSIPLSTITAAVSLKKMRLVGYADNGVDVTYTSSSGGVDTYSTFSGINNTDDAGDQDMRVLVPTSPNTGYEHAFLWLLPVEPGQGTTFGDSIATVQTLGAHNDYNLTCIQPGFPVDPWYGNNVDDPQTQQERFMLDLVKWANSTLATTGKEKHYLIGFSKSGFGGQVLFMRNQPTFAGVASWDAAMDYETLAQYDGTDVFGTQDQLNTYALYDPNLAMWKTEGDTGTFNRIWLGAGINLVTATSDYSDRLTTDTILHTYSYVETDSHNWAPSPGWVGPALAAMVGVPTVTGVVKLKKMVLSGAVLDGITFTTIFNGSTDGDFSEDSATGDTLLIFVALYNVDGPSSSNPKCEGTSIDGTVQLWEVQNPDGDGGAMYSSAWMLPNLPFPGSGFSIDTSGGNYPSPDGAFVVVKVTGLGSSPTVDRVITNESIAGDDGSIGPTSAIRDAKELIIAHAAIYGSWPDDGPGSPWTSSAAAYGSGGHGIVSYQIVDSSGGTYSWAETGNGSPWAGGIATIAATVDSVSATGAVKLKKMVLSGASAEKAVATGSVKLKKMVISGTSHEKTVVSAVINLKKMIIAASSADRQIISGAIRLKKISLTGTSTEAAVATGVISLKKFVISGSSHEKAVVTGTIQLHKMRVHAEQARRKTPSFFIFAPT